MDTNLKNKILIISIFSTLLFNSDFIKFLFTNSLMSEGFVSLFFVITFYEFANNNDLKNKSFNIVLFTFGMLYMTKQFVSSFTLVALIYMLINKDLRSRFHYLLSGFLLHRIFYFVNLKDVSPNHHFSQFDFLDTIFDILLFRDVRYENILLIFRNLFKDKPFVVFLFALIVSILITKLSIKDNSLLVNFSLFFIILNLIFILLLYSSAWRDMELESPIRYIFNLFHLKLFLLQVNLDKIDKD